MAPDPKKKPPQHVHPAARVQQLLNHLDDQLLHAAESLKDAFHLAQESRDPSTSAVEQLELQLAAFRHELERVIRRRASETQGGRHV